MEIIDTIIFFIMLFVLPGIAGGIEKDLIGLADGFKFLFCFLLIIETIRFIAKKLHDLFKQIK